jgi:hypothetical protein
LLGVIALLKRHFLALLITLSVYCIPPIIYNVSGYAEWLNAVVWSSIYCFLIYRYTKIRVMILLLAAESLAATCVGLAFAEHHIFKSDGFFYANYESIINACFIAELLTIAVGVVSGFAIKRLYRIWLSVFDRGSHRSSVVHLRENLV